jgi:hypothetical protein
MSLRHEIAIEVVRHLGCHTFEREFVSQSTQGDQMARRLEAFPASASTRYPWAEWPDGSPWELVRGEDS